ncbi:MAG: PDZ domain-containing protein [Planctomycetes bacterium]|nr:PDZ domain-containing protein [Planctomycetota bacterium]
MKTKTTQFRFVGSVAAVVAVTALCSTTLGASSDDKEIRRSFVFSTSGGPVQSHSESHTIAIRNIDGKITVKVNGKEIPADRIKHKDGRVIILDDDGKEMAFGNIWIGDNDDEHGIMPWVMRFHGAEGNELIADSMRLFFDTDVAFDGSSFEHPKVMLGIQLSPPGEALEIHLRLDPDSATMISRVYEGLAAHEAGLEKYDIIVAINGETPADHKGIREVLSDQEPGNEITLTIIHKGKKRKVNVELQAYSAQQLHGLQLGEGGMLMFPFDREGEGFGFRFQPGSKEWRKLLIDPRRGDLFRLPELDGGKLILRLNKGLLNRIHEQLGDDAAEKLHERLRGHLPGAIRERLHGEDGLKLRQRLWRDDDDGRVKALNDRLEELKRMLDELVQEAEELDDGEV